MCAGLNILEDNMSLTTHLVRLHGHDVEDRPICGEQGIKRGAKVMLIDLVRKVGAVQPKELLVSDTEINRSSRTVKLTFDWDDL